MVTLFDALVELVDPDLLQELRAGREMLKEKETEIERLRQEVKTLQEQVEDLQPGAQQAAPTHEDKLPGMQNRP